MHDAMMETLARYRMERAKELIQDPENLFEKAAIRAEITVHTMLFFIQCVLSWLWMELIIKKHSGVIQHFQRDYIKTGIFDKEYSQIIMSANEIRNASDYDDFFIASRTETEEQILAAKKFYKAVEGYLTSRIEE